MRVRFTVRWVMLAVALVAVAGAGVRWVAAMRYRSERFQDRADLHEVKRRFAAIRSGYTHYSAAEKDAAKKSAEWHAKQRDLYNGLSALPWRDAPPAEEPQFDVITPKDEARAGRRRDAPPVEDDGPELGQLPLHRAGRRRDAPPVEGPRYD